MSSLSTLDETHGVAVGKVAATRRALGSPPPTPAPGRNGLIRAAGEDMGEGVLRVLKGYPRIWDGPAEAAEPRGRL